MAGGATSDAVDSGGVGGGGFGEVRGGGCFAIIPAMPGKEVRSAGLGDDAGAGMPIPAGAGTDGAIDRDDAGGALNAGDVRR